MKLWALSIAAAAAIAASQAAAQSFPTKLITLVVPAPPGGTTDIVARGIVEGMTKELGQNVIVENKAGAGGNIGADYVAKATPDGHTLLVSYAGPLAINAALFKNMPYNMERDFAPIAELAAVPIILVANPKLGVHDVKGLIAKAKAAPGKLVYGSQANGTTSHLTMELLKSTAKVDITHIPYKGSAPAMTALLSNEVNVMFDNSPTVLPQIQQGSIVPLGVASAKRIDTAPKVPTLTEQGLTGFESTAWFGIVAPAKTPPAVIAKLNAAVNAALKVPSMVKRSKDQGMELIGGTPEQFGTFLKSETAKWGAIAKSSGATAD